MQAGDRAIKHVPWCKRAHKYVCGHVDVRVYGVRRVQARLYVRFVLAYAHMCTAACLRAGLRACVRVRARVRRACIVLCVRAVRAPL
eukprot:6185605-Pleurochrysis_carterae.AAC.5